MRLHRGHAGGWLGRSTRRRRRARGEGAADGVDAVRGRQCCNLHGGATAEPTQVADRREHGYSAPTELRFTAAFCERADGDRDRGRIRRTPRRSGTRGGDYAGEAVSVTVTIAAAPARAAGARARPLQVTGGGTMYPDFAGGVRHLRRWRDPAGNRTGASAAQVTLLRAEQPGVVEWQPGRSGGRRRHRIAIELRPATRSPMSCTAFPQVSPTRILKKTEDASDGLHWLRRTTFPQLCGVAIVDNNGVPRFRRYQLPRHADGPVATGPILHQEIRQARRTVRGNRFAAGRTATSTDYHALITVMFISYQRATRDLCAGAALPGERPRWCSPTGIEVFRWNSWDHLKLADCRHPETMHTSIRCIWQEATSSLRSRRRCCASTVGAVVWQMGGTATAQP